jgi:hypothetical protein
MSSFQDLLNNRWYEVAEKIAREKVGQALRDAINQKEQQKEEEESNNSLQKRRRLTGEDDYEDRRPFPNFLAKPTSEVGVTTPAAISLMLFQNQQDVATMMHSPLQFGSGFVRRNTVVRMEEVFSKMMCTEKGASTISGRISTSKHDYQESLRPPSTKIEDHHQGALPPITHHNDNHLMPKWSLADLEPRPLRPPYPSFTSNKKGNDFIISAGLVPDEDDQQHTAGR